MSNKDLFEHTEGRPVWVVDVAAATMRDLGLFRHIADTMTVLLAAGFALVQPRLLLRFIRLNLSIKSFKYGARHDENIHIFNHDKTESSTNDVVVVFVHGGAWGSGRPWMYKLATEGICTVLNASKGILVEYPVYPIATIFDQAHSILDAVQYIQHNRSALKLSQETKIILAGHSSGAHISVLASIASCREGAKLVDIVLGLSGVYDIGSHFDFEKNRGVHIISPMRSAALGPDEWDHCSPSQILQKPFVPLPDKHVDTHSNDSAAASAAGDASSLSMGWPVHLFPKFWFLHGTRDSTVPHTSTEDVIKALQGRGCDVRAVYADYEHIDPIIDLTMLATDTAVAKALSDFDDGHHSVQ
jgi:acetyl esterase/lipase